MKNWLEKYLLKKLNSKNESSFYINAPFGKDFVRSVRWAAKSRGRVQRHPENALMALSVLREAGYKIYFNQKAKTGHHHPTNLKKI